MKPDPILSLIGFAIRARKVLYGLDALTPVGRRVYAVIYDSRLSPGSTAKLKSVAAYKHAAVVRCALELDEITHKTNCRVVGITDRQMARAILQNTNENFIQEPAEV